MGWAVFFTVNPVKYQKVPSKNTGNKDINLTQIFNKNVTRQTDRQTNNGWKYGSYVLLDRLHISRCNKDALSSPIMLNGTCFNNF